MRSCPSCSHFIKLTKLLVFVATAEWLLQQPGLDLESRTTDLQHKLGATSLHLVSSKRPPSRCFLRRCHSGF